MKRVMDKIWELMTNEESMNRVPLYDETTPKGFSYKQLRILSGRVYAYLKAQGIGKEDFVMIQLPRGAQPIIAMLGIWRAGAACVIVEDNFAPERINFIYKDCACKMAITNDVWELINSYEPIDGYEETDPHDAAYAVYTSGTTGNPKGVLHEFGNLDRCIESANYQGKPLFVPGERYAHVAPLNFVASVMVMTYNLYLGWSSSYILSYSTIKNPIALMKFLLMKRISIIFLTPTYARKFAGKTGPFLKALVVGSEPAHRLYLNGVTNYNMYAQSESGVITCLFVIDKEYDVCPVGRPQFDLKYRIVDEDGNDVPEGEIGEFIFENPYVRGYINLPEASAKAFRNGFYYSDDLVQVLPDGNIAICGRKNDMIKINGNRIEPAEIEAAIQAVLNVEWCTVKGFVSDEQSFICAYYKDDIIIDADRVRNQLQKRLPYYMIPSHFMKLDTIPVKANGKLDRSALPKPKVGETTGIYKAPTTETEAALCNAMQKALGLERVGVDDDFYEMGGDSLASMEVLVASNLPGLDVGMIFRGRTPHKISKIYLEYFNNRDTDSDEFQNESAKQEAHKLTAEQLYMFNYQLYTPKSTMYNLFTMLRIEKSGMDLDRLSMAMEMAIKNHPSLRTMLEFDENGDVVQKYNPELPVSVNIERIEQTEFEKLKDTLVQSFKIVNAPLFRCRLFETEEAVYMFFDVHHIIFDGTSFKVLLNSIVNAYIGLPMEIDYYYLMLQRREQIALTEFYRESCEYFEQNYGKEEWTVCPTVDFKTRENEMGSLGVKEEATVAQLSMVEKKLMASRNEFYIAVTLLAIALSTGKNAVQVSWIYNGRDDLTASSSVGLFYRDLPVALKLQENSSIRDIFAEVHEQVQNGIKYSCFPYVENTDWVVDGDITCVLYQKDIREIGEIQGLDVEMIEILQNKMASQNVLDIQILDGEDGIQYVFDYAASRYDEKTMVEFQKIFCRIVSVLLTNTSLDTCTFGNLQKEIRGSKGILQMVKKHLGRLKQ